MPPPDRDLTQDDPLEDFEARESFLGQTKQVFVSGTGSRRSSSTPLRALPLPAFAHCEVTELPLFTGGELARRDPARVLREARRLLSTER